MSAGFESIYASHPLHLGAVRWNAQRVTLIVKLAYGISAGGVLALVPFEAQPDLQVDRFDEGGDVVWPSDFAPFKPGCDVAVVGADVALRSEPASLMVGPLALQAAAGDRLGARESFASDPTAGEVFELWTSGAVPATRFHAAAPHLRTALLAPPFDIAYARGSSRISARFTGPWPALSILDRAGRRLAQLVPAIDFVGIEATAGRVTLVGRVVYDASAAPLEVSTVVVELSPHPTLAASDRWHTPRLVEPADAEPAATTAARPPAGAAFEGTAAAPPAAATSSTGDSRAAFRQTISSTSTSGSAPRRAAPVLPFEPTPISPTSSPAQSSQPVGFAELRKPAQTRPAWDAGEGTVVATSPVAARPVETTAAVVEPPAAPSFGVPITLSSAPILAASPVVATTKATKLEVDETVVRIARRDEPLLPFRETRNVVSPPLPRAAEPQTKPTAGGWTDDGSGTRAAVVMPVRGLPFRSRAAKGAGARAESPPSLSTAELRARMRALDAPDAIPAIPVRATLVVELERWAARLEDPSPTGPLAVLLHEGAPG